jgi:hypothetical protein
MQWHEDGYQVTTIGTHIYSPDGYNMEFEHLCFIAIPIQFVNFTHYIPRLAHNTLGRPALEVIM